MEKIDAIKWEPLHLPSTNFTSPSSSAPSEYTFCPLVMELSILAAKDSLSTAPLIFSKDLFLQLFLFPSQFLCLHRIAPLSIQLLCLTNILFMFALTPHLPPLQLFHSKQLSRVGSFYHLYLSAYTFPRISQWGFSFPLSLEMTAVKDTSGFSTPKPLGNSVFLQPDVWATLPLQQWTPWSTL